MNQAPIGADANGKNHDRQHAHQLLDQLDPGQLAAVHGQDTWRIRPTLTLTYGLSYSFQTPNNFGNRAETMLVNTTNNQPISGLAYLQAKLSAANQGQIYNPPLGFEPVTQLGRSGPYNADYGDVAPRASLAWSPHYTNGLFGKL